MSPPTNPRRLHRSKNNHRKFIAIGQIIGSDQIDSFMSIESVIASISIFNYRKLIKHRLNFGFKFKNLVHQFSGKWLSISNNGNIIGMNRMGGLKH